MTHPPHRQASPTTFADALAAQLRRDGARPLVTFYDDATGERIELSVTTYANWVAKTAGLAQDDLGLERGDLVLLDLPVHWLGAVWLGAAWSLGLTVTDDPSLREVADLVVCGPERPASYAGGAAPVVALSLRPLGGRFVDPLPPGVVDYGDVVLAQPDSFAADDPPSGDDLAWRDGAGTLTQAEVLAAAATSGDGLAGARLLTDVSATCRAGLDTLLVPVVADAATVWVRHPDEAAWDRRVEQERVGAQRRAG